MAELDRALRELDADERRFGPSHMGLFSQTAMDAHPAQSLDARMASNASRPCEQPSPPGDLFNPFPPRILQDMASYRHGSHGLYSGPTMDLGIDTIGLSYIGVISPDTGQYFGPGVSTMPLADHAFTSTAEAPRFNLDAQMSNVFGATNEPLYFPVPTTTSGPFAGLSVNGLSAAGTTTSNALHFSDPPSNDSPFEHVDFSVFPVVFMSSASAERSQLGSVPGLANSLAECAINIPSTQHESSARPVLRTPSNGQFFSERSTSNGASPTDTVQNPSVVFENVSSPVGVVCFSNIGAVVWEWSRVSSYRRASRFG
jgi:hypothetical protein